MMSLRIIHIAQHIVIIISIKKLIYLIFDAFQDNQDIIRVWQVKSDSEPTGLGKGNGTIDEEDLPRKHNYNLGDAYVAV